MRTRASRDFRRGDWVIYEIHKSSNHPGLHAREVVPSSRGDDYQYAIDKQWIVTELRGDDVVVRTRRGKLRVVSRHDPALRRPSLWERLTLRSRFPRPGDTAEDRGSDLHGG
jgi:hypothetical protein